MTTAQQKVEELRAAYASAPQYVKTALENALPGMKPAAETQVESAGRIGVRLGKVSELTIIVPFAPGGAERLRKVLKVLNGNFNAGKKVGTLHNMRFAFLDNDTKFLFATAYDGEWDPYIDDFATKIPDEMDVLFSAGAGWPGIRNVQATKDWIVAHQIPADAWFVAHPDLSVAETERVMRIGKAVDEFLDKVA